MMMFLAGFLLCAILDVIVLLFYREKFMVVLERVDEWVESGQWD